MISGNINFRPRSNKIMHLSLSLSLFPRMLRGRLFILPRNRDLCATDTPVITRGWLLEQSIFNQINPPNKLESHGIEKQFEKGRRIKCCESVGERKRKGGAEWGTKIEKRRGSESDRKKKRMSTKGALRITEIPVPSWGCILF